MYFVTFNRRALRFKKLENIEFQPLKQPLQLHYIALLVFFSPVILVTFLYITHFFFLKEKKKQFPIKKGHCALVVRSLTTNREPVSSQWYSSILSCYSVLQPFFEAKPLMAAKEEAFKGYTSSKKTNVAKSVVVCGGVAISRRPA